MSTSTKSSIKFALLAYSVYCWVDGSARTRNNFGSGFDIDSLAQSEFSDDGSSLFGNVRPWWDWLVRRGSTMTEEEQAVIGKMDVVTAFLLFNAIQRLSFPKHSHLQPILPVALPQTAGRLSWKILALAAALLSLLHETQRAAVLYHLRSRRAKLAFQVRKDLAHMRIGEVLVRGDDVTQPPNEEDEEECLICSGSAETMSTSSHTGTDRTIGLGPLEAFCTIAPQKHLAHRSCFLRWHAAYIQQRGPAHHSVALLDDKNNTVPLEHLFIRASIVLRAAGFDYLTPKLKRSTDETGTHGDKLTVHQPPEIGQSSPNRDNRHLATLRTSAPPCPACRSPVCLRFIDARPPPVSPPSAPQPPAATAHATHVQSRVTRLLRSIITSKFWHEWTKLVTGRTLSSYFGSLLSFMAVLAAITKARENPSALFVTSRMSL